MRRVCTLFVAFVLIAGPNSPLTTHVDAQVPGANEAASLIALSAVLQNLRSNIDEVINTVDSAAAARLRQTQIVIDKAIQDIGTIIDKGTTRSQKLEKSGSSNCSTACQHPTKSFSRTLG
jgi:hypothetical protein